MFFVPPESANEVKEACFRAGAGEFGGYDRCSWESQGCGQFRPLSGSKPSLGVVGQLHSLDELRVEMLCSDEKLIQVIEALKSAHPYEVPAFYALPVLEASRFQPYT